MSERITSSVVNVSNPSQKNKFTTLHATRIRSTSGCYAIAFRGDFHMIVKD